MTIDRDPFGRSYRSGRLSDEETAERMLRTGVARVMREGLRVSFDLLRLEDLIAEAGVARSAVYRRWPTKNHYYADLLRRLTDFEGSGLNRYAAATVGTVVAALRERIDRLASPEGRRSVLVELCRIGIEHNFLTVSEAPEWHIYVTIAATMTTLPDDGELRRDLQRSLYESESSFFDRMAGVYTTLWGLVGYRVRPDLAELDMRTIGQIGAAIVEGVGLNSIADPQMRARRFRIDPYHTGEQAEWSLPALGFTSLLLSLLEPDPAAPGPWDGAQLAARRRTLEEFARGLEPDAP